MENQTPLNTYPNTSPTSGVPEPQMSQEPPKEPAKEESNSAKSFFGLALIIILIIAAYFLFNDRSGVALNTEGVRNSVGNSNNVAAALSVFSNDDFGDFMVDENGMTLYVSSEDCTGACLGGWQPYVYDDRGILGDLGLVARSDTGELQYTYNDQPLYYYLGDAKPGDVNGHGLNGTWSVVRSN